MLLVAVILPVFNGAKSVARAIESALNQSFDGRYEIIVINDGSTDATADVLKRYDHRITVIDQLNRGPAAARNTAVAQTSAEYIAFLDADDAFMTEKLARTVPPLASQPNAVMLFHNAIAVSAEGRELSPYVWPERAHAPSMEEMLSSWWPIVPSTVVMRRATFDACGGFSEEFRMPGYEDPDLWIRAREHGEFIYMPECLTWYTTPESRTERMERYLRSQALFFRRLRQRYGDRADELIHSTVRSYTNWLSHQGRLAMQRRDLVAARNYFVRVLRQRPGDVKSMLRFLRTFLPAPLARALSGRTAGGKRRRLDE